MDENRVVITVGYGTGEVFGRVVNNAYGIEATYFPSGHQHSVWQTGEGIDWILLKERDRLKAELDRGTH